MLRGKFVKDWGRLIVLKVELIFSTLGFEFYLKSPKNGTLKEDFFIFVHVAFGIMR